MHEKGIPARARRRFSQNFLRDTGIARRILAAFDPTPGDRVVEVGPGHGALTELLVERVTRLVVVEIDRDLAAALARRWPALDVRCGDILDQPLAALGDGEPVRILSNLPYTISSPFLSKLTGEIEAVVDATLLLQLEFAERMAATVATRPYSALSVATQLYFEVDRHFEIPPQAFRPRPRVHSRLVGLRPRPPEARPPLELRPRLRRVVGAAFSARRKRIDRGLSIGLGIERDLVRAELTAHGIDPALRPERLEPGAYALLAAGRLGDPPT